MITNFLVHSQDAGPAVYGSTTAIFRRVELIHEALVFMILRGDKEQLTDYNFTSKESSSLPSRQLTRMSIIFYPWYFTDGTSFSSLSNCQCHLT
jgi:hypothetical protein